MLLKINDNKACPADIKEEFQTSRKAPESFIQFHRELAEDELAALCSHSGATIHNEWMQTDGWYDGFKALHVIIETRKEKLLKIKWHEGNQCFVKKCPNSGAWMTMRPEELDNDVFTDLMHKFPERSLMIRNS